MDDQPGLGGSDRLTIVVHLPQDVTKIVGLLNALAEQWPDTIVEGNRIEIAADE